MLSLVYYMELTSMVLLSLVSLISSFIIFTTMSSSEPNFSTSSIPPIIFEPPFAFHQELDDLIKTQQISPTQAHQLAQDDLVIAAIMKMGSRQEMRKFIVQKLGLN